MSQGSAHEPVNITIGTTHAEPMSIPVSMQNSTIQSFVSKGSVKSMAAVGSNPLKASIAEKQRKMEEIKEAYQKRTLQPSPKKPNKTIAKKRSQERDD